MQQHRLTPQALAQELEEIRAAQNNPKRFGVLYERYYRMIFLFVYKRVDDEDLSSDLTSQVFLKAMLHLKRYQYRGVPFSAWLYRIAVNEVNMHFRNSQTQRTISLERSGVREIADEVDEKKSEEGLRNMISAIDTMSEEEVQWIEFRYFEKLPFKEIAEIYQITENNAKVRMYRILQKLKKRIEELSVSSSQD